jgi:hypothetical protein
MVVVALPAEVVQLKKLALALQAPLVRESHYSLAQTAVLVLVLVLEQVHCLLPDVVLQSVQEQVQQDHLLLA